MLNPPLVATEIHCAEPLTLNTELDPPKTIMELMESSNKTKRDEASGYDRIPYEFYEGATSVFFDICETLPSRI